MTIDDTCLWCGVALPFDAQATIKYCGVNHRMAAYRERLRTRVINLDRFGMDPIDLELRRRASALINPSTHRRAVHHVDDGAARPPAPPTPEPIAALDDIDVWFLTPIHLDGS